MDKPILFNTEMVQAILDGRKTVTRRVVKLPKHVQEQANGLYTLFADGTCYENQNLEEIENYIAPPYQVGDILWVRETFYQYGEWFDVEQRISEDECIIKKQFVPQGNKPIYFMDTLPSDIEVKKGFKSGRGYYKRPSLFMPRSAARIFLKVTDVRVERLQDILCGDMQREGCIPKTVKGGQWQQWQNDYFKPLWDSTIKPQDFDKYSWTANPWVWVIEFERVEHNDNS